MSNANLFLRLEGYARENFTTETLAYILETDNKVRRAFLELLLRGPKSKRMLAAFGDYAVKTQASYDIGRPDLVVTSKATPVKIWVEVKTQSPTTEGQIQKYLKRQSHVAYLTPPGYPPLQDKSDNYLGHFFWDEVHSVIKRVNPNKFLHGQFLGYLEARHMALKPITSSELRTAAASVDFVRKSEALVGKVREKIDWPSVFGPDEGEKRIASDIRSGDLHSWYYRPKNWWKGRRGFYLCIGTGFEEHQRQPMFYLCVGSAQKRFWRDLDYDLAKRFQKLCDKFKWKKDPDTFDYEWAYRKFFPLGTGEIEQIAERQAKNVRSAVKELQQLQIIRSMENKL
jgi:hypothetical protein